MKEIVCVCACVCVCVCVRACVQVCVIHTCTLPVSCMCFQSTVERWRRSIQSVTAGSIHCVQPSHGDQG